MPLFDFVCDGLHWRGGKIPETLIYLILPVRRVDKSKTEGDEDNKVR